MLKNYKSTTETEDHSYHIVKSNGVLLKFVVQPDAAQLKSKKGFHVSSVNDKSRH